MPIRSQISTEKVKNKKQKNDMKPLGTLIHSRLVKYILFCQKLSLSLQEAQSTPQLVQLLRLFIIPPLKFVNISTLKILGGLALQNSLITLWPYWCIPSDTLLFSGTLTKALPSCSLCNCWLTAFRTY